MASVFFALFRTFFYLHFLLSIEGKDSREKSARVRLRILKRFVILSREVISEKGEEETPMKKCIVAPDSFKGSLSSRAACEAVREVLGNLAPRCEVLSIPIADGGEGTVDCFEQALPGSQRVVVRCGGPYGEPLEVSYLRRGDTAVLEMALCAGLPLVEGRENPLATSTFGVGEMIAAAVRSGCRHLVLGLGGSCTNDAGAGMAAALGAVFWDHAGRPFVPTGGTLSNIADYDVSAVVDLLRGVEVTAMCDIDSPMHGLQGAAYVFAPQKGASEEEVRVLDAGLKSVEGVMTRKLGRSLAAVPGAGAAGAMGAGVLAFLGGTLKPGIDTVLDFVDFDGLLAGADLVITGEGRVDAQSCRGKVISGIAARAKRRGVPVVVLAGSVESGSEGLYDCGVTAMFSINRKCEPFEVSRHQARANLSSAVDNLLRLWLQVERPG